MTKFTHGKRVHVNSQSTTCTSFQSALLELIGFNVVLAVVFWLIRIPMMNEHFQLAGLNSGKRSQAQQILDAAYASIMTQSTVGASDLLPITDVARIVTGLQALSTFAVVVIVVIMACTSVHGS